MSERVYIIIEHCGSWDGCESYDEVRAVTGNPTIAENLIEGYKNELVDKTYKEGGIAKEITEEVGGDVTVVTDQRTNCCIVRYIYYWTIEEFKIIES